MASVEVHDENAISYEISGSLTAADDDGTSSSESGDESASESSNHVGDDSDEELEVFSSGISNVSHGGGHSRVSAQISIVKEVRTEKGKDLTVFDPPSLTPLSHPPAIHDGHYSSQNAENVHLTENDEDDEFGWDEETRDNSFLTELLSREKQVDQPIDFTDDLQRFQEALAITSIAENEEEPSESYTKGAIIDRLRSQSAQALQDVVSVYGDGLGDQSILIDENITKAKYDDAGDALKTGVLSAIAEEEDEEDEDEDDDVPTSRGNPIAIKTAIDDTTNRDRDFDALENFGTTEPIAASVDEATKTPPTFVVLSSQDIQSYLCSSNLSIYESRIRIREESKSWFTGIMSTKLRYDDCENELKRPFLFAEVDYDPYNDMHLNLLRTIYSFFLPEPNLQPLDSRWERIGFQGGDPRTDLNRSMKILTLVLVRNDLSGLLMMSRVNAGLILCYRRGNCKNESLIWLILYLQCQNALCWSSHRKRTSRAAGLSLV